MAEVKGSVVLGIRLKFGWGRTKLTEMEGKYMKRACEKEEKSLANGGEGLGTKDQPAEAKISKTREPDDGGTSKDYYIEEK